MCHVKATGLAGGLLEWAETWWAAMLAGNWALLLSAAPSCTARLADPTSWGHEHSHTHLPEAIQLLAALLPVHQPPHSTHLPAYPANPTQPNTSQRSHAARTSQKPSNFWRHSSRSNVLRSTRAIVSLPPAELTLQRHMWQQNSGRAANGRIATLTAFAHVPASTACALACTPDSLNAECARLIQHTRERPPKL